MRSMRRGKWVGIGVVGSIAFLLASLSVASGASMMQPQPESMMQVAASHAHKKMNPCNPCAAKNPCNPCNPCAAKRMNPCNPCAAKNPCNPCNPCGGGKINSRLITRPDGTQLYARASKAQLLKEGKQLWNDRSLGNSGLACSTCHMNHGNLKRTFLKPYPHRVDMPQQRAGLHKVDADEMVQFCMVVPMAAKPLGWNSRKLAALTAYTHAVQREFITAVAKNPCLLKQAAANPCNPCAAKNPCNPCGAKMNPCNPCAAKKMNPCNPCGAKMNPCNPCAAKKMNPCNPCGKKKW